MANKGKIKEDEFKNHSIALQREGPWSIANKISKAILRRLLIITEFLTHLSTLAGIKR